MDPRLQGIDEAFIPDQRERTMMGASNHATINALYFYPIKGLSPVSVRQAALRADDGFPGDRLFGFAKANSGFDPANPKPLPKDRFLVLMQQEKLAELHTTFDDATREFVVVIAGHETLRADLAKAEGQAAVSDFFMDFLQLSPDEKPFFAEAQPHRFTDVSVVSETMMNAVSIINLASVRDFAAQIGELVDPLRFRGNIILDGLPAFSELDLIGQIIEVGNVRFKVLKRTKRCAATEVNPATAERDIRVPALLRATYGHFDMGIYAQVISDGTIGVDDVLSVEPQP